MEFKVNACGKQVGKCLVLDRGLYWKIECGFHLPEKKMLRLFGGGRSLGLPVCCGDRWSLDKTISKSSLPEFPPQNEVFYVLDAAPSRITVYGYEICGYPDKAEDQLLFRIPGIQNAPHPCMPLLCFFTFCDGFWILKLNETGELCF